jgi:cobaltochelatase CobT
VADKPYQVYCRDFDVEVEADKLETVLVAVPGRGLDETSVQWLKEVESELDAGSANRAAVVREAAAQVRTASGPETLDDAIVSVLIDHSGSMRGAPMGMASVAAMTASELLDGLGVKHEILGFTTVRWKGGLSREKWLRDGRPAGPGRLNDLLHIVYCSAGERLQARHCAAMRRMELLKENIDGEAIEWAVARLRGRREGRKCLVVVSDGAPVDDSTLAENSGSYLARHLRDVIEDVGEAGDVHLAAVGIGYEVGRYYAHSITINVPEELAGALVGMITEVLCPPPRPAQDPTDRDPTDKRGV